MYAISRILFCILTISCLFLCKESRADIATGLVGWWKLNEGSGSTGKDSSGNGNTGTLGNSPSWVSGKIWPFALSFNGSNQSVQVASTTNYDSTFGTWSAWIKTGTLNGGYPIILSRSNSDSSSGISFFLDGSTGQFRVQIYNASKAMALDKQGGSSLIDNNWHQLVVTFTPDGQTTTLYVDGSSVASGIVSFTWAFNSQAFNMATSLDPFWKYFLGSVEDVRIYNRALSQGDVTELYNLQSTILFNHAKINSFHG